MAKAKKVGREKAARKGSGGPYLAAAFFCESLIQEQADNSVTSAIRIVDTFVAKLPPDAPADLPSKEKPVPITLTGLISFRASNAPGRHTVGLRVVGPSGKAKRLPESPMELKPGPI